MRALDTVRLLIAKPEHGLLAGAVGVIVGELAVPFLAFEVEFCNDEGATLVVAAIEPDALEPMPDILSPDGAVATIATGRG